MILYSLKIFSYILVENTFSCGLAITTIVIHTKEKLYNKLVLTKSTHTNEKSLFSRRYFWEKWHVSPKKLNVVISLEIKLLFFLLVDIVKWIYVSKQRQLFMGDIFSLQHPLLEVSTIDKFHTFNVNEYFLSILCLL